jgi:molybdopterin synthase catalytic subunit
MSVKVKLFAQLRDAIDTNEIILEVDGNMTTRDIIDKIYKSYPVLKSLKIPYSLALNKEIVDDNAIVKDGDEIALLPPINGG